MKDGSIKESELLEEATSIFKNMNSMPGMNNLDDLFKSMNLGDLLPKGGKVNTNAFQNMMDQNIKMAKTKERMRKKAEQNREKATNYSQNYQSGETKESENLDSINNNLASLMEQMKTQNDVIDELLKNQNINKDVKTDGTKTNNKKKKRNRKKN